MNHANSGLPWRTNRYLPSWWCFLFHLRWESQTICCYPPYSDYHVTQMRCLVCGACWEVMH